MLLQWCATVTWCSDEWRPPPSQHIYISTQLSIQLSRYLHTRHAGAGDGGGGGQRGPGPGQAQGGSGRQTAAQQAQGGG